MDCFYTNKYEEDYEPTREELEEYMGSEDTTTKIDSKSIKIEFDTANFANGIILDVVKTVKDNLKNEIINTIKKEVLSNINEEIKNNVHSIVREIVLNYIEEDKVILNKSAWDSEVEEISVKQYTKNCIKDIIETGKFRVPVVNSYGKSTYNNYTFEEYVKENLQINEDVKKYLDKNIDDIRKTINQDIKDIFNESTKTMLSNTIVQLLMANSTYKELETSLSTLATKKE